MKLEYDKGADVLYVTFRQVRHVTCLERAQGVLTRIDPVERSVVGFTFLNFSDLVDDLGAVELPFIEDEEMAAKLTESVRLSWPELCKTGKKSLPCHPRFTFTPKMAALLDSKVDKGLCHALEVMHREEATELPEGTLAYGTAGSLVMVCPKCGKEHFRNACRVLAFRKQEYCVWCGDVELVPLKRATR